ncbi:MAG TPA: DUF4231 domain-containing protein [Ktedonobacteraceae bacterium]|nr:DUF4231 domain-containing protein [Ktedonobacteraceae bacterium]
MSGDEKEASNEQITASLKKQANDALQFYDDLIRDFKARADRHKQMFKLLRYSSVSLAIAATLVSTLVLSFTSIQGIYLWIIPIFTGLSALSTTLLSATNSQERWVHSRGVQRELESERFLFVQQAGRYTAPDEGANVRLFSERLVEIWSEGHEGWARSVTNASHETSTRI